MCLRDVYAYVGKVLRNNTSLVYEVMRYVRGISWEQLKSNNVRNGHTFYVKHYSGFV